MYISTTPVGGGASNLLGEGSVVHAGAWSALVMTAVGRRFVDYLRAGGVTSRYWRGLISSNGLSLRLRSYDVVITVGNQCIRFISACAECPVASDHQSHLGCISADAECPIKSVSCCRCISADAEWPQFNQDPGLVQRVYLCGCRSGPLLLDAYLFCRLRVWILGGYSGSPFRWHLTGGSCSVRRSSRIHSLQDCSSGRMRYEFGRSRVGVLAVCATIFVLSVSSVDSWCCCWDGATQRSLSLGLLSLGSSLGLVGSNPALGSGLDEHPGVRS